MKRTAWMAAAFAAGLVVSAASTRARAEVTPLPSWMIQGACFIAPETQTEFVLEIHGGWVRTTRSSDGSEVWRNLAEAAWLKRQSPDACRQSRQ